MLWMKMLKLFPSGHQSSFIFPVLLLLQSVILLVKCQDGGNPPQFFSMEPQCGSPVREGDVKILQCQAYSIPAASYSWMKDGQVLQNERQSTLIMSNIDRAKAGAYRCIANNSHGAIISKSCDVVVAYLDPFPPSPNETIRVSSGNAVTIDLPPLNSVPTPSVSWRKNGQQMLEEGPSHQVTFNNDLVLLDTKLFENNTMYHAYALNGATGKFNESHIFTLYVSESGSVIVPPSIEVAPVNTTVKPGSYAVKFECVVNARPLTGLRTEWYRVNGDQRQLIVGNQEKYMFPTRYKRQLLIRSPVSSDSGVYECEAVLSTTDGRQRRVTASAYLNVITKPQIISQVKQEYEKTYRENIEVECKADGNPVPTIHWYFNAEEITTSNSRSTRTVTENGTLIINSLDLVDSGMYQCVARNDAGEAIKFAWIKVISKPPEIIRKPSNFTIIENNDARLACEVEGAPKPDVVWTRETTNGVEVITSGGRIQVLDTELLVASAVADDSGLYTCNATNNRGTVSAQAHLLVLVRTQIIQSPQNISVVKGAMASLPCGVKNDPDVSVTWKWYFYNPTRSEISTVTGRHSISLTGTLSITGVYNVDIGQYQCEVISIGGNDTRTAYLQVIELPHAPRISSVMLYTEDFRSVNVSWSPGFDGHSAIERFIMQYRQVSGLMLPEEGWNTMQNPILSSSRWHIVDRLRPARNYQFRVSAVNAVGEGPYSTPHPALPGITMPEQAPSSPPRGFYGQPSTNTSISLYWQPPEESTWNGNLTGYVIRFKLAGYSDVTYQTRNTTNWAETTYVLTNLIIYQEYDIQIAAYNSKGVGNFTPPYRVRTKEGRPTRPPRNVEVLPVNSTCINVTWLPPDGNYFNGIVRGYSIYLKHDGVGQPNIVTIPPDPLDPNGLQVKYLCNLLKYANYTVSVLCFTNEGNGPASTEQIVRTNEDVPGEVGNLRFTNIRDTSLKVSWTVPELVNGILLDYVIMWEKKNLSTTIQRVELKPTFTYYTIQQLSPSTKYTIYVYARTAVGAGPTKSADIESGVPPELPKPPTNLGYSNVKARSVYIQFYPGFDGNTSITQWIVEGQVGDSLQWQEIYSISKPTARDFTVHNLKPYTQYVLRIIAVNIVGPSNPSIPSERFQTLQAPPNVPPDNVTVRAVNSTALRVSWTPLAKENWNGNPRGYRIFHKLKDDVTFTEVVLDMDKDSFILSNLQEWMIYQVKMKAFNDVGSSGFSPVTSERTRDAKPTAGPSNVAGLAVSSTSINVTWGDVPALEQNGEILGYKVQYESLDEDILPEIQDVPGNTTKSVLIVKLRKYVRYQVQVLAYTRMGDGILSQPKINVTTHEDVPGPPVMIWFPEVSFSTAKVVWSPPLEPNGILTGYMVSYKMRDGTVITNSSELNPARREFTVASLTGQVYYIFMVKASTRLGWGDTASVLVYTSTSRSIPQSPSKPNITSDIQPRSITISWQSGFDGYGPLRNYTVEFKSHNGQWTETEDTVPPTSTSYTVTGLRPNTKYSFRVAATNDVGTSEFSPPSDEVKTREDEPEGAPVNVIAVPITTSSIQVTWDPPPMSVWNSDNLTYIVRIREYYLAGSWNLSDMLNMYDTQKHVFTNLTERITYEIQVKACNEYGCGYWSYSQQPPVSTWNGDILGYLVQYRKVDMVSFAEKPIRFPNQATILDHLTKFVNYEIRIIAYNSAGNSPHSTPTIIYVGEAAPAAPPQNLKINATSSTELYLSWEPPPPETQNGALSGYKVSYWLTSSAVPDLTPKIILREKQVVLNKLKIFSNYSVQVLAYNLAGEGPKSSIGFGRTREGVPGPPRKMEVNNVTMTTLTVSWIPPEHPNGIIINYELAYYLQHSHDESQLVKLRVPGTRHYDVIDGLVMNNTYTFSIRAMTSVEPPGPPISLNITMGPQPGSPGRPMELSTVIKDNSVYLSWVNGESGLYPITGYDIQSRHENEGEWKTIFKKMSEGTSAIITFVNLVPDENYIFRVIAYNRKGMGQPSWPSQAIKVPKIEKQVESKPFHYQWWFSVIVALAGLSVILVIVSFLCLVARSQARGRKKKTNAMPIGAIPAPEPEEGGFTSVEMRQSRRSLATIRNGNVRNKYARGPPRPSPASVTYSETYSDADAGASSKPPIPDDNSSSLSDKPSDLGDSTEPSDEESEFDSEKPLPQPPASPPPPPFSNPYINTPGVNESWRNQNSHYNNNFNAYNYTDSEAESSHYAMSLNSGQLIMNNTAGSRAPLPGFSSFV